MVLGETININFEEFERYYDSNEFEVEKNEYIVDQDRWHTHYEAIYSKDGEFYRLNWSRGSTEYQDDGPENMFVTRVERKEKTVYVYE